MRVYIRMAACCMLHALQASLVHILHHMLCARSCLSSGNRCCTAAAEASSHAGVVIPPFAADSQNNNQQAAVQVHCPALPLARGIGYLGPCMGHHVMNIVDVVVVMVYLPLLRPIPSQQWRTVSLCLAATTNVDCGGHIMFFHMAPRCVC